MSPLCPLYFLMLYTSVLSAPNHLRSGIQNEGRDSSRPQVLLPGFVTLLFADLETETRGKDLAP